MKKSGYIFQKKREFSLQTFWTANLSCYCSMFFQRRHHEFQKFPIFSKSDLVVNSSKIHFCLRMRFLMSSKNGIVTLRFGIALIIQSHSCSPAQNPILSLYLNPHLWCNSEKKIKGISDMQKYISETLIGWWYSLLHF